MIQIQNKQDCCGCTACVQRCPKHCISLKEDNEGFLYPIVNESLCINCGLCEKVCPIINTPKKISAKEVLAVKNRNVMERMASSSGGVFIALARSIIEKGGVVFGAVFDRKWEVMHTYTETMDGVYPMMGSKYVQSRIGDSYREAEHFLKEGRDVLFTGTPCQITGLHNFLRKTYPNLLSVDCLCHGVPSPEVWRRYLDEISDSSRRATTGKNSVLSSSLKPLPAITDIEFRNKKLHGWKKFSFVIHGFAFKTDKYSVLLSDTHRDNPFMKGFLADIYLRPSCYCCKCKNGISQSDLTIADFWGINIISPDFDDDKGVGLVLVNTTKGKEIFEQLQMDVLDFSSQREKIHNGGFNEIVPMHPKRSFFFKMLDEGRSVEDAVKRSLYISFYTRCIMKIKCLCKKCRL